MAAIEHDLVIEQGTTFGLLFAMRQTLSDGTKAPLDLTGYSVSFTVRLLRDGRFGRVLVNATTDNGMITFTDQAAGKGKILIPASVTAEMRGAEAVYDIEISQADFVRRIMRGNITISPDVRP